jgi:UDP-glucose 4-epimerase
MKKIFVSGGNGFIGKNFLANSDSIYQIDAPLRTELELTNAQQVKQYFENKSYDCIVHSAGTSMTRKNTRDQPKAFDATINAFKSVFTQNHAYQKFIQLGSGAEYARPIMQRQIHETELEKKIPTDQYGLAKQLCSKMLSQGEKKSISLILFGVFGPYEDYQIRFISNAIVRTLHNLPIVMNQNAEFDYVYVFDVINIIHQFIEKYPTHLYYNITAGQPVTLIEIAELIRDVLGTKNEILIKNPGLSSCYTGDNSRLIELLGSDFKFTPLRDAIKALAHWYQARIDTLNQEWIHHPL